MFPQFMRGRNPLNALYVIIAFHQNSIWIDTILQFMKGRNNWHSMEQFKCLICDFNFTPKDNLNEHVSTVHEGKKPFKFSNCDACFTRENHLQKHISAVHEKMKPFKCSKCESSFSLKGDMNRHNTSVHEGKKEFQCSRKGTSNCTNSIFVMVAFSDESEPSWLELKDFQLGSARDLFPFSSKSKIGQTHKNTLKITSNLLYYIESIFR